MTGAGTPFGFPQIISVAPFVYRHHLYQKKSAVRDVIIKKRMAPFVSSYRSKLAISMSIKTDRPGTRVIISSLTRLTRKYIKLERKKKSLLTTTQ